MVFADTRKERELCVLSHCVKKGLSVAQIQWTGIDGASSLIVLQNCATLKLSGKGTFCLPQTLGQKFDCSSPASDGNPVELEQR